MNINAKEIEARTLAKIASRNEGMTTDQKLRHCQGLLANSQRAVEIDGERREITSVRVTYGGGLQMTLDRPLRGKSSNLLTISARWLPSALENILVFPEVK